ncbi:hypothetical protein OAU24_00610 [bacterium]|nr:hypothetical protein [bacterium]
MHKDIKIAFKSWYVIDGDEHLKMGSFSDAVALMEARARNSKGSQLIMMSDKEYGNWFKRKTKKGKNS